MNHLHLIDWRAGVDSGKRRPTVSRLERRAKRIALRAWLVLVHMLAGFGGLCLLAKFLTNCGAV